MDYLKNRKIFLAFTLSMASIMATGCMTSARQNEINKNIGTIHEDVNDINQKIETSNRQLNSTTKEILGFQRTIDNFKSQLSETNGIVDELKSKIKTIEQNSGAEANKKSEVNQNQLDAMESSLIKLQRQIAKLQLEMRAASVPKVGRLPAKVKKSEDLSKMLATLFEKGNSKEVIHVTTAVLTASKVSPEMLEIALNYRAEARFLNQDYKGAALDLVEFLDLYPNSKKIARAYLLLGDSYVYLKNKPVALSYYSDCLKNFPNSVEGKACQARFTALENQLNAERSGRLNSIH